MDDSVRDCPESSRASKLTGLALRPYSPLSLGVLDQSGGPVVTRRGLAPLNVPDEITRIINISGKVLHDTKKRVDLAAIVAVSSRSTRLDEVDNFDDSISTYVLTGEHDIFNHARPSPSPLTTLPPANISSFITSSDSVIQIVTPPKHVDRPISPSAYAPYEESVTQKLEKEFQFISSPKSRQISPNRKSGVKMTLRQGMFWYPITDAPLIYDLLHVRSNHALPCMHPRRLTARSECDAVGEIADEHSIRSGRSNHYRFCLTILLRQLAG